MPSRGMTQASILEDSSSKLCSPCYQVRTRMLGPKKLDSGPKPQDKFKLHDNYNQLSNCKSCPLCQYIRRELLYVKEENGSYRWPSPTSFSAAVAITATVAWGMKIFQHRERYSSLKIEVGGRVAMEYNDPVVNIQGSDLGREQQELPRPKDTYGKMRNWIQDCLKQHSGCPKDTDEFRPTRLLDLAEGNIRLTLSEMEIQKKRGRENHYATLSYCWGTPGLNATTTKDNFEARRRDIPFDSLPKTVQDAIKLTRELGIRFLWVDALCIIQGDQEDWARESEIMGKVYRKSICTIAACVGDDCNSGLFTRREAAQLPAQRVMFTEGGNYGRGMTLHPEVDHWYSSVELSTLSTRGWVMQERILAGRTVFCTEEGVFWQCVEKSSSEFKETVITDWEDGKSPKTSKPRFNDLVKDWRADAQEYDFKPTGKVTTDQISMFTAGMMRRKGRKVEARPWHKLVYEFTRRDLTQPNDRLRAVQGIANEFAASTNDVYVENSGVWKSDILGGMAWYRQWDRDATRIPIAPSWSWASTTGEIVSMYERTKHVVNLAEVNWTKTSLKKLSQGSISILELHISGQVCLVKIYGRSGSDDRIFNAVDSASEPPPPPQQPKKFLGFINRTLDWNKLSGVKTAAGIDGNLGWSGPASKVQKDHYEVIFDSSLENPPMGKEYLCMPIVGVGFQAPSPQVFPAGLVLEHTDSTRKVYRRVGWCFMWAMIPDEKLREVEITIA